MLSMHNRMRAREMQLLNVAVAESMVVGSLPHTATEHDGSATPPPPRELAMAPANSWQVTLDADGRLHWAASPNQSWMHEPTVGFWRRFKSGLFGLLPVEKYL